MKYILTPLFLLLLLGISLIRPESAESIVLNKTIAAQSSLKSGLVGWWTFDGNKVGTNGSIFYALENISGLKATSTGNTTPSRSSGKLGQSLYFDAAGYPNSDYLRTNYSSNLQFTGDFSVSAWAKNTKGVVGSFGIVTNSFNSPFKGYSLVIASGRPGFIIGDGAVTASTLANVTTYNDGKWHYYTGVRLNGVSYLYIDGVKQTDQDTIAYADSGLPTVIGDYYGNTDGIYGFKGDIDDVRVYNRALSAAEIKQLYAMGGGKVNTTQTKTQNLNSGLVGWWTMDGKDCGSTYCIDKSGNGNTGTRTLVTPVGGKIGQAMSFNGTSSKIDAGNSLSVSSTFGGNYTVGMWIKVSSSAIQTLWWKPNIAFGTIGVYLSGVSTGKASFYSGSNLGADTLQSTIALNNGKWRHLVFQLEGTTQRIYVDGVLNNSKTKVAGTSVDSNFVLGVNGVSYPYSGQMDDVRIYNRALSLAEIQQLYKQGGGKVNTTQTKTQNLNSGLVGWWTFDGADVNATKVLDKSGAGNHGTRNGGVLMSMGKIGQSGKFDGAAGSYVNCGAAGAGLTDNFSLFAWIKTTKSRGRIIARRGATAQFDFQIVAAGTVLALYDGITTYAGSKNVRDGKWHFVGVVFNGSNTWFYADGAKDGTVFSPTITARDVNCNIGAWSDGPYTSDNMDGAIDDVRIYNRALSDKEITQLYRMGK